MAEDDDLDELVQLSYMGGSFDHSGEDVAIRHHDEDAAIDRELEDWDDLLEGVAALFDIHDEDTSEVPHSADNEADSDVDMAVEGASSDSEAADHANAEPRGRKNADPLMERGNSDPVMAREPPVEGQARSSNADEGTLDRVLEDKYQADLPHDGPQLPQHGGPLRKRKRWPTRDVAMAEPAAKRRRFTATAAALGAASTWTVEMVDAAVPGMLLMAAFLGSWLLWFDGA